MLGNWKISAHQFRNLVILCFIGTSILITPGVLAVEAKQDAWIASIVGSLIGLLLAWFYNSVGNLFPNMTFTDYIEKLLGKWLGKIVSLLYISFLFINAAAIIWIVSNFITTQILTETPIQFTNILLVTIIVMGTRLGLETLARATEVLFPWVIILFIILVIFSLKNIKFQNIQPVFEYGMKPIIRGAVFYVSYSSLTLITLMMIFPAYVNNIKEAKKSFLMGTFIGGIMVFLITALCISVLGHEITARNVFPTYVLAKKISIGGFLERLESIIAILWLITIFFKAVFYFYGAVLGLAQTLKLKDYRPVTLPLGVILVVLPLVLYPNTTYASTWDTTTWMSYAIVYGFFLPLLLFIVSYFKNK